MMYISETFAFSVARPSQEVYEYLLQPTNFAEWAFTGDVAMRHLGDRDWAVESSVGPRIIRFADRNAYGVLDHHILRDQNDVPHLTGLRVVGNCAGSEVIYTNFRRAGQDAVEWRSALEWVKTDLLTMQSLLEARGRVMPIYPASTVALSIDRPLDEVRAFLEAPANFAMWVFAGDAHMKHVGNGDWAVETSVGPRIIHFADGNPLGVADYTSTIKGTPPHPVPVRVLANGSGTELTYTFYQRPNTTDAEWQSIREWVTADLIALKSLLEARDDAKSRPGLRDAG